MRHTEVLTIAAAAVHNLEAAERRREVLQFSAITIDNGDEDDDNSTTSNGTADTDAPFINYLNSGASRVFKVPSFRPK